MGNAFDAWPACGATSALSCAVLVLLITTHESALRLRRRERLCATSDTSDVVIVQVYDRADDQQRDHPIRAFLLQLFLRSLGVSPEASCRSTPRKTLARCNTPLLYLPFDSTWFAHRLADVDLRHDDQVGSSQLGLLCRSRCDVRARHNLCPCRSQRRKRTDARSLHVHPVQRGNVPGQLHTLVIPLLELQDPRRHHICVPSASTGLSALCFAPL